MGHFHFALDLFRQFEKRDPAEIIPPSLPDPIEYKSHRDFVREVLTEEVDLRARGKHFIGKDEETADSPSRLYRDQLKARNLL